MIDGASSEGLLHGSEDEQIAHYRAVSFLAVLALLLGLAAPLALAHVFLWFVPVAAAAVAVAALWQIAGSDELAGRWAAVVGLMLAVFFGAWAPVQYFARGAILARQARQAAEGFFAVIQEGDLEKAHQWMLPLTDRAPADSNLHEFYESTPPAKDQLDDFKSKAFVRRLWGNEGLRPRFVETVNVVVYARANEDFVTLRFELPAAEPGDPPLLADVSLKRLWIKSPARVVWQVIRVDDVGEE